MRTGAYNTICKEHYGDSKMLLSAGAVQKYQGQQEYSSVGKLNLSLRGL